MQIIALIIIALCLIAIAYRDFKTALISLFAILAAAMLFYFFSPQENTDNALLKQVSLSQSTITIGYANGFVLNTRIHNADLHQTVQTILVRSSLKDCNADQSQCLTIGEQDNLIKTRIPPRQARDVRVNLNIKQLSPIEGASVWAHQAIGVN